MPAGITLRVVYTLTTVDVILTKSETFAECQTRNGLLVPDNGITANPDKDGVRNLVEYALGLNPLLAETTPLVSGGIVTVGGQKYLSLTARMTTICTATQAAPFTTKSIDFSAFTTTGVVLQSSVLDNATQIRTMTWRSTVPIGSTAQEFLRLETTLNP